MIKSRYQIDGQPYYSFEDIGAYLYPDLHDPIATNKVRNIYKVRKDILKAFTKKAKSWWSHQTIIVLNAEGTSKLLEYSKGR